MSNGIIVRLIPLTPAQISGGFSNGADAGFPIGNLADPQPKVVWRRPAITGAWTAVVDVDLLADTFVDTVGLLSTNAGPDASWFVAGASAADGIAALDAPASFMFGATGGSAYGTFGVAPTTRWPLRHGLLTGAGRTVRHVRLYYQDDAGVPGGVWRAGNVVVGQSWKCGNPQFNFELGAGRKIIDLSDKRVLPGGENGRWAKAKVPAFRATWSSIEDIDLLPLWSIYRQVGFTEPLLVVEDPDPTPGQNERIHYCTIDSLDYYQRTQLDKSTIELKVTEWL